ncbi:uncharacterized protein BX663DRAFT_494427 [Cokeromyces recurvatus]|uniref:uncharacterized protein n=1 Tax=Cokeromyces recurvatus TaxID=90255 RepID=UPI00221E5AD8|nr:uncharacterized protein BX663DRAFT_494427 [Cokeromyces recurvatus]KAI7906989.1 hypothetical protein BX663DRAFT_494427 [Cokeromyces recurvatus]
METTTNLKSKNNSHRITQPLSMQSSPSSFNKPSSLSPSPYYDPLKLKRPRRINSPSSVLNSHSGITTKHLSVISSNSTSDAGLYSNKSNISSVAWTTLSNDPFSQIEVNTSAFTDITDQSTISRKSLYPVSDSITQTASSSPFHQFFNQNNNSHNNRKHLINAISTEDILNMLNTYPQQSHLIIKEAYQRAQQQNDPFDWTQFYNALEQYTSFSLINDSNHIAIVYLAKCLISGLGVTTDIDRGFDLLKSNPSCEAYYTLGQCYLNGIQIGKKVDKTAAFECFRRASECMQINESTLTTIAEAQCALARMLFQGEGVEQNTNEALNYLHKSAKNNNMYAQFLIGVHYERGFDIPQDLKKAKEYYKKSAQQGFPDAQAALGDRLIIEHDYVQGIEWLEKAIQKGNSRAHVQLGILYDKGEGIPQNNDMALFHYKAAVENNNHAAQYILGLVYYFGRLDRQRNHKEAIRLIKQSAMAGFPYAQRVLGQLYQQGNVILPPQDTTISIDSRQRTKKNEREAIRWYKRAATTGKDVPAMALLGKCYEYGIGVDIDLEKALAFYAKAAEIDSPYMYNVQIDQALLLQKLARHTDAFRLYSHVLKYGDPVKDKQSIQTAHLSVARYHLCREAIEGIQYDPVLAHKMLLNLVETSSNPHAHYWLGSIYDEGIPELFDIDRLKAFQHFMIAAEGGDNDATFLVAYMMSNQVIPLKGPEDAFPWYQKAAIKGHPMSMHSLGLCYYKGIGQEDNKPNLETALEWFQKAARLGIHESISYMARIYLQFMVTHHYEGLTQLAQQDRTSAIQCLKQSAERDNTYAQRELGKMYLTGHGLNTDFHMAIDLLSKAAAKNDAEAMAFLGDCYHKGTGTERNLDIAVEYYLKAAKLGYPYAYSATAELYYEIDNLTLAYDYYLLASKEPKIEQNKTGMTARMMVARLALGYIPSVQTNARGLQELLDTKKTICPEVAFNILSELAIQYQFSDAFQPLGVCYLNGTGTKANALQAVFWFRKSAEEFNDRIAYFNLADIYGSGLIEGISVNIRLALTYLERSAELGYTEAQYRMGMIYLHGEYDEIQVDKHKATDWFKLAESKSHPESAWMLAQMASMNHDHELELHYQRKAASLGHVFAMRVIGQKYLEQLDAPFLNAPMQQQECLEEALRYLHLAGDAGDTESLIILGKAYNNCIKTKIKFSPPLVTNETHQLPPTPSSTQTSLCEDNEENESRFQSEEDEKNLAIQCFERASHLGDMNATLYAAEAWYEQKQYAAALEYFEKAASQGSVLARFFCARYCIEGYGGIELNPEKGFQELLICANELNCVHAYNTLGQCYENGIGTDKDDQLAYEWYIRSAEMTHDAEAYYRIAQMYAQGRISASNKDIEAFKFYDLAVNANPENHGLSCYYLGLYYLKGIPKEDDDLHSFLLSPDICMSIEYLRTASDLNVPEAMLQLGTLFLNENFCIEEQEEGFAKLQLAAELGLREAQFELGLFYHRGKEANIEERDDTHQKENKDDDDDDEYIIIQQDFEKAYDLFCRSAAQRHPTATYYLGIYHQHGIFVPPDPIIALEQYEIAVQLFEIYKNAPYRWQAEYNLGRILHHDIDSRTRAYKLFQAAHQHAPLEFQYLSKMMIARYHLYGWANDDITSIQASKEEAAATLIQFAKDEDFGYRVYLDVAQCYENGLGVEQDLNQAFYWYSELINKSYSLADQQKEIFSTMMMLLDEEIEEDEATAMFKLAEFYRRGLVDKVDIKKADDLYRLAASKGSYAAQEHLSFILERTTIHD